jgi:hypothetical protein
MEHPWRDLGRRARACDGWRPLPGILYVSPAGPVRASDAGPRDPEDIPDFTDPATLGCLLALVRDAWRDPNVFVERIWDTGPDPKSSGWLARGSGPPTRRSITGTWPTEAACLVEALEAAPQR